MIVLEGPVLEPADEHAVTRTDYPSGISWTCACGAWEAFATGPSSARWAAHDHTQHVTATRSKEHHR